MVVLWVTPGPGAGKVTLNRDGLAFHWVTSIRITDVVSGDVAADLPRRPNPFGSSFYSLEEGSTAAHLLDLSTDLPQGAVAPGRYSLQLRHDGVDADPVEVVIRAPTVQEKARIDGLKAEIALWTSFISWNDWVLRPIRSEWSVHPPTSKKDPLRYFLLLRYLYQGPVEPANVPSNLFDMLDGMYAPFAACLRVDLAFAKGRTEGATEALAQALAAHPEIAAQLAVTDRTSLSDVQMERDGMKDVRANNEIWAARAAHPPPSTPLPPEKWEVLR